MQIHRFFATAVAMIMLVATTAFAGEYRYVKQEVFREWLVTGRPMVIVDIQEPDQYRKRHFRQAVETNAYPAKTEGERRKLEAALPAIRASTTDVIIVCPRGGGGAKNSYDHLVAKGVSADRLLILEKGMEGWPYPELTVKGVEPK